MNPRPGTSTSKMQLVIGSVLIVLAWLMSAGMVLALLTVLPEHHVRDYAAWIVSAGVLTAGSATWAVIQGVIQNKSIE